MASVFEFATTVALLFGFLARRFGAWGGSRCGWIAPADAKTLRPSASDRYRHAGLLVWTCAAFTFWKGLNEPKGGCWRVATGVLVGLAFVEKMGTVLVVLPMIVWLAFGPLLKSIRRRDWAAWFDGLFMTIAMGMPLFVAYREVVRLNREFLAILSLHGVSAEKLSPAATDLFRDHPQTWMPVRSCFCLSAFGSCGDWPRSRCARILFSVASGRRWKRGPRCSRLVRPWLGWETPSGGARRSRDWLTITGSQPCAEASCRISKSSISDKRMNIAYLGIMLGF